MVKDYKVVDKRKVGRMVYRRTLELIICLGLFSILTSLLLFSSPQVSFAQLSSSTETSPSQDVQGTNSQHAELEAARQRYLSAWNNTAFSSQFDVFIEEGSHAGYGMYREHVPANVFRPGETIVLYVEQVGFGHQPVIDGDNVNNTITLYRMNMTADYIISDSNGTQLATIEDVQAGELVTHRQNTEFSLTLTLSQEEPFPVGDYMITYVVHDHVTGQNFQINRPIAVGDNATTGGPQLPEDDESMQFAPLQQPQQGQQPPGQGTQLPPTSFLTFEDPVFGMRFDYPSDWTANELENGVEFEIPGTDPFTAVAVRTNPVRLSTADDVLRSVVNELRIFGQFGNFEILETGATTLGGQAAERATISYSLGPDSSHENLLIAAVVGNNSYVINFVATPSEFDSLMPSVQRIIDSFEFIGLSG